MEEKGRWADIVVGVGWGLGSRLRELMMRERGVGW